MSNVDVIVAGKLTVASSNDNGEFISVGLVVKFSAR